MNLGYACLNMSLSNRKKSERITTNRSMIRRTFDQKGVDYASELALQNCKDLYSILQWNEEHNIKFFRLSSQFFPWASEYDIESLKDYEKIMYWCKKSGDYARENGHRLTSHPGPFNKLTSPKEHVIQNTITDLEIHGKFFDMLGLPRTPYAKMNIHVGAHYNNKAMALENFCKNFERLSPAVQSRLTVENDDKASLYSTKELHDEDFKRIGIPVVHDVHHHKFCTGGIDDEEAMLTAAMTWDNVKPVIHYSQSLAIEHNNTRIKANAHSDSYWEPVYTHGLDVDVMLECKHKEIGLFKMRELLG